MQRGQSPSALLWAISFVRSAVFHALFVTLSIPFVIAALAVSRLSRQSLFKVVRAWSIMHRILARAVLGIRVVVEGMLPDTPVLVALKHESMFEAVDITCLLGNPAIIVKAELIAIPLWGKAGLIYGFIAVDRDGGAKSLRTMMGQAKSAVAENRKLAIFPEGTRVAVGETPELKSGFAGLYKLLNLPVVPVAVQAGHVFPPRAFVKFPGTVRYKVMPTIPPKLPREEIEARVQESINALNRLADGANG